MVRSILFKAALAALILSILGGSGCILNPNEGGGDKIKDITWPDLSNKEDPIETIRILYKNFKVLSDDQIEARYSNVLYDDPADVLDYIWYMSDLDVINGYDPIMTRPEDIEGTKYLLKNASVMTFYISDGTWAVSTLCEGCQQSIRTYTFSTTVYVQAKAEYQEYIATDYNVMFIIGPHQDDPNKWAIYQVQDIGAL